MSSGFLDLVELINVALMMGIIMPIGGFRIDDGSKL